MWIIKIFLILFLIASAVGDDTEKLIKRDYGLEVGNIENHQSFGMYTYTDYSLNHEDNIKRAFENNLYHDRSSAEDARVSSGHVANKLWNKHAHSSLVAYRTVLVYVSQPVPAEIRHPVIVPVPYPVPHIVEKPYPVNVNRLVPVFIKKTVPVPVPYPINHFNTSTSGYAISQLPNDINQVHLHTSTTGSEYEHSGHGIDESNNKEYLYPVSSKKLM